ncbi:MAG: ABC transporter substrate-binding protein [Sphingomonadales bacterium]|nr:ABC transporter substrate-binding protein [Sphingomonadales bacterium]
MATGLIARATLSSLAAAMFLTASPALAKSSECRDGKSDALRLTGREVSIMPQLTQALGNFEKEGVKVELVFEKIYEEPHYRMQRALKRCDIDMSVHWFQHVYFGHGHDEPAVALMMFNGAPGLTVMVSDRIKGKVKSGADFRGLKVSEGMNYSTKSIVMNLLRARGGLPAGAYTPVNSGVEGRLPATIKGLDEGEVDIIAFREPHASEILKTGKVSVLYDLTTPAKTKKLLGAELPAQSLFTSPNFLRDHPDQVQKVVNAFVRTMRFVNTHSAEEVAAAMPDYFKGKNVEAEVALLRANMPTFVTGNYRFTGAQAKLMQEAINSANYEGTEEGAFRQRAQGQHLTNAQLFDNRFVDRAMKKIRK